MSTTHAWLASEAAQWWPRVADHLWQATLFALFIFVATFLLRRGSARIRHALWVLASLKLLLPATLLVVVIESANLNLASIKNGLLSSASESAVWQSFSEPVSAISQTYAMTVVSSSSAHHREIYCALTVIWVLGALSLLMVWIIRRRRFLQALELGRRVDEGREWKVFERAKSALGLKTPVNLVLAQCRTEPTVARVWRPLVMLPESICDQLNDKELEAIMLHELVHVQRRDNLIGNLQMMVCASLWFFPVVWLISRRLISEREQACDEKVLKVGGAPDAYASSILKVLRFSFGWKVAGVSGAGDGSNLSRRIKNIMSHNPKRSAPTSRIFAAMLLSLAFVLTIAAGINTRARAVNSSGVQGSDSTSLFEQVISSLASNEQRRKRSAKTPPPVPPQPPQAPQPAQVPQPAPPAQAPQPSQPSQPSAVSPSTPPTPPTAPVPGTRPSAVAPPAASAPSTPPSPASAPAPPRQEIPDSQDENGKLDKRSLIEAPPPGLST